jgi:hypothetical protein
MQPPPLPPPRQAPAPQWPVMNNNGCNPVPYPPFIVVLFTADINVDIPYPPCISRMHPLNPNGFLDVVLDDLILCDFVIEQPIESQPNQPVQEQSHSSNCERCAHDWVLPEPHSGYCTT